MSMLRKNEKKVFSRRFQIAREFLGANQDDFDSIPSRSGFPEAVCTMSPATVGRWERGQPAPTSAILKKIAAFYNVPEESCFDEEKYSEDDFIELLRAGSRARSFGKDKVDIQKKETDQPASDELDIDEFFHYFQQGRVTVTIDYPKNGDRFPHPVPMKGTVQGLPENLEIWIVKEPHSGNFHPDNGPVLIQGEKWIGNAYIGNNAPLADQGISFTIHLVVISKEGGNQFRQYLDRAHKDNSWLGLPSVLDGRVVSTVTVIRDDAVNEPLENDIKNSKSEPLHSALEAAQRKAAEWASNGYKYHVVEKIGKELLADFRDPSYCHVDFDEHTNILLLVSAVHFGTYWCHWAKLNKDNITAAKVLFSVLNIPYVRPRLRTLYALQLFTDKIIQQALKEKTDSITGNDKTLIQSYVLNESVIDYLLKIKEHPAIGKKAKMVIQEIVIQGQEEVEGYNSSGLPVI